MPRERVVIFGFQGRSRGESDVHHSMNDGWIGRGDEVIDVFIVDGEDDTISFTPMQKIQRRSKNTAVVNLLLLLCLDLSYTRTHQMQEI